MARPLRIEFENAVYHVTARGDRREPIFEDDFDRQTLLSIAALGFERFDAQALAYCLMGNHYHWVLQTRQANLSRLMRHINAHYSQTYNRRHGLVGHVFQGRFKAIVVDTDAYLLEVCRYVDLNPVRAGMVQAPGDWAWSSYRAHAGATERPTWLDSRALYQQLAPRAPVRDGAARYAGFVAQGRDVRLWDEALQGQIYLGDADFAARTQARVASAQSIEVPKNQRRPVRQPLMEYLTAPDRDHGILQAYRAGGYSQTEIARQCGLSISRISRLIKAGENQAKGKT
jgi:putative transposase